jgi:hypothetical protein
MTSSMDAPQSGPTSDEPSFTRVARPSATGGETAAETDWSQNQWESTSSSGGNKLTLVGWAALGACGTVGIWLLMRWQQERNKPINRFRRQARQTASQARQTAVQLRERVPDLPQLPDQAARPAVGLSTALVSLALLLWQRSASRSRAEARAEEARRRAQQTSGLAGLFTRKSVDSLRSTDWQKRGRQSAQALADIDWQQRLVQLKELWTPSRLEMENMPIGRR